MNRVDTDAVRVVEHHLGTAITLHVHDAPDMAVADFFATVAHLETVLSRFLPDSEISRLAAGELCFDDASPVVREVMTECERLRIATEGCFDHQPRLRSGDDGDPLLDPNAFAKGWIIEQACLRLKMAGVKSFFANAGGDIVTGGPPPGRSGWRVGIQHPDNPEAVLDVIEVHDVAVATSGTYERGDHIRSVPGLDPLKSVTVIGPELGQADALATAVFASGEGMPSWWDSNGPYALMVVDHRNMVLSTENLDRYRSQR
jgi:thiamine biosynthesis lipoprotein